jgi:uncharacterized membrane protein
MDARSRLALSAAVGLVALVPAVFFITWFIAALVGWDVTAAVFIVSVWLSTRGCDAEGTRERALRTDDSRVVADAVLLGASLASLVGVAFALVEAAGVKGAAHSGIVAVAIASVVLSWAAVHTVFTLHYARLYYGVGGGIDFHDRDLPEFGDFAYVALTIGMTFQVSDTDLVSKPIRRAALRHALLSYLFGVVVVAMTINVVASLLTK